MALDDMLVIRDAMLEDSKALAGLLEELGYPRTEDFVNERLMTLNQDLGTRIFVAVKQGRVVGFASCHVMPLMHASDDLCRVTALIVSRAYRHQNIGCKLMRAVEKYAKDAGCARVEITSGERRRGAHVFYERIGYKVASRRFLKDVEK